MEHVDNLVKTLSEKKILAAHRILSLFRGFIEIYRILEGYPWAVWDQGPEVKDSLS